MRESCKIGWHALVSVEEQTRLADRSGLQSIPLRNLVEAVNLGKQTEDGSFENLPNCVYLPLIGTSPAVTALSDLRIKPQTYAQLVICDDTVFPEFLAGFFNSPLGRKTRDAMLSGTYIPKINKQTILDATAYTLPLDAQRKATDAGREIQELRLRLEQLERDLWSRPVDAERVRKAVTAINPKESFESWLETLPFPLASILWRYQAASSAEHKVIHLLNFFEAAVQFLGTVMASAFHSNEVFFKEHRRDWFESGKDIGVSVKAAKEVAFKLDADYVSQQITRMEAAVSSDPELAIGTAKEFLETVCQTILADRAIAHSEDEDLPKLVKLTVENLKLVPDAVTGKATDQVRVLLKNLAAVGHQLAELRNALGTGHGKSASHKGLEVRHARLMVGAATALGVLSVRESPIH